MRVLVPVALTGFFWLLAYLNAALDLLHYHLLHLSGVLIFVGALTTLLTPRPATRSDPWISFDKVLIFAASLIGNFFFVMAIEIFERGP